MADELLGLVLAGTKTATAGLTRDYAETGEALPEPGGHWIAVDGQGMARCVVRTVEIRLGSLRSVDAAFAWDEGEGDRTRAWWVDAHRRFFLRQCERDAVSFDEDHDEAVLARFQLVWPKSRRATTPQRSPKGPHRSGRRRHHARVGGTSPHTGDAAHPSTVSVVRRACQA